MDAIAAEPMSNETVRRLVERDCEDGWNYPRRRAVEKLLIHYPVTPMWRPRSIDEPQLTQSTRYQMMAVIRVAQ